MPDDTRRYRVPPLGRGYAPLPKPPAIEGRARWERHEALEHLDNLASQLATAAHTHENTPSDIQHLALLVKQAVIDYRRLVK